MRVILLDDVPRLGHEGEAAEVADGYFRNYLEPRKLAVRATKGALKDLEARQRAIEGRDQQKRGKADELAARLREKKVVVRAQTGEGTRLHGSVTAQQIAEAARQQLDFDIDRRDIDIPEPIRETGDYLVTARVYKDVDAQLAVSVIPIEAEEDVAAEGKSAKREAKAAEDEPAAEEPAEDEEVEEATEAEEDE